MRNDIVSISESKDLIIFLDAVLYRNFCLKLELGVEIEFYLHDCDDIEKFKAIYEDKIISERGKNQYEINLDKTSNLITACNSFYSAKNKLISAANESNYLIDFAAKPINGDYGSAAHYHLTLLDDNSVNIFGIDGNSHFMESIIASLLELTNPSLYLLTAASASDFERFIPNFMAPINLSWGGNNRTTLIRIPDCSKKYKRIEFRLPSSTAPIEYIIIFLLIAVMEGLKCEKTPPNKIYGNAADGQYKLTPLLANLIEAKKHFRFMEIIANYTS